MIGTVLTRVMKARDLTPGAVARQALGKDVSQSQFDGFVNYFARIRSGGVPSPGLLQLQRIARGLNVSLTSIIAAWEGLDIRVVGSVEASESEPPQSTEDKNRAIGQTPTKDVGENTKEAGNLVLIQPGSPGAPDAQLVPIAASADPAVLENALLRRIGFALLRDSAIAERHPNDAGHAEHEDRRREGQVPRTHSRGRKSH